ncbi:M14 family zinc carboxypeptidase [Anaerobacillus sp. MEB173]|uniref:M14 family zinc carboxypeptidase n=1 Tax=Anaerobacillus sp. MEB173 TaxID=3383345 RepID=UPI003F90EE15
MMNYIVKQGDTIAKVAYQHRVRPFDLMIANQQLQHEKQYIYPGEKLVIPAPYLAEYREEDDLQCLMEYGPMDVLEDCRYLSKKFSNLCQIETIGYSVMGKPIQMLVIGHGKKEVFYSGGWHANEWLTTKFLMVFAKHMLQHLEKEELWHKYDLKEIFSDIKLFIVPLVNPDGVELVQQGIYKEHPYYKKVLEINKGIRQFDHWSSNIRGVDLNHQWPAGWDIEAKESPQHPWSRHYSGKGPLTEPEAQAVYQLTMSQNFSHVLAFHSQGQVIYWGYRHLEPTISEEMVTRLSLLSSYVPVHTADSDGGYKDWFIQEKRRPGFTIEVGVGTNPLPFSSFSEIWSNNVLLALEGLIL